MTTNRRQFLALSGLGLSAAAVAVAGCGSGSASNTDTLRYQGWAGTVIPPELAEDLGYLDGIKLRWVGNTISGPQDIQSAATGQVDFGGAFNGAVVKLASSGAKITSVIGYYGSDKASYTGYYTLADSPIKSAKDLEGKKVGMNTLGAHSEAMLDIWLQRRGLSQADITKVEPTVVPPVNAEQSLRAKQTDATALDGILRDKMLGRGGVRELFKDTDLFNGGFTAGTYVIKDDFIEENPATVKTFVAGVAKAIEWSKKTPRKDVIDRFTKIVKARKRNEDLEPLQYWKSYGVTDRGGVIKDSELQLWIDWLAGRGDIKSKPNVKDLYTNKFNPYAKGGKS